MFPTSNTSVSNATAVIVLSGSGKTVVRVTRAVGPLEVVPVGPVGPRRPAEPAEPVGPLAPVGPVGPFFGLQQQGLHEHEEQLRILDQGVGTTSSI